MSSEETTLKVGHHFWETLKGVCSFMQVHFRRYFSGSVTYTLIISVVCVLLGFLISLKLGSEMAEVYGSVDGGIKSFIHVSSFYHITGTSKYLGLICCLPLAMAIANDLITPNNDKFTLAQIFRSVNAKGWSLFSIALVSVLLVNALLYKDLFGVATIGVGFFEVDFKNESWAYFQWINSIFEFLKSLIPYFAGGLAFIYWKTSKKQRSKKVVFKAVITASMIFYMLDVVMQMMIFDVSDLFKGPLSILFKSEIFSIIFTWGIFIPLLTCFALLFSAAYIKATDIPEFKLDLPETEDLLFPSE